MRHPALHGLGVTDPPPRKEVVAAHRFLMTEPGLLCYCYQELYKKYKELEQNSLLSKTNP